ncbi:MAG: YbjQ family protein [Thermoanaerobaculaceae bacterium]|jgi:uncharacterized protein YbjQ (UPF0145 family)|nr:YbjQ family protein [Thermoanaerobaculaceae bacterium]
MEPEKALAAPPRPSRLLCLGRQLGVQAVTGIRRDVTELMQGVSEVLCHGTAVVVQAG